MAKKATKKVATKTASAKPSAGAKPKQAAKSAPRKAAAPKKPATRKSPTTKPAATKSATKKSAAKPASSKKAATKKAAPKKATAKKTATKKVDAKSRSDAAKAKTAQTKSKKAAPTKAAQTKAAKTKKTKKQTKSAAPRPKAPRRDRPKSGLQAAFEAALAVSEEPKRAATKLKADELDEFRQLLLVKRAQLVGDFEQLSDEAHANRRTDSAGDLSSMPIHMADIGSDNWDQEFNLVLLQNERNLLREIDDALERIKDGTYGICIATGRPISKARLRAKPWAKYCIEYARKKEIGHG